MSMINQLLTTQMVIAKHEQINWEQTTNLDDTDRGAGGFGHTGTK